MSYFYKVYNTENKDLKFASNRRPKWFDLKINKMRFSVTAYNEELIKWLFSKQINRTYKLSIIFNMKSTG